MRLIVIFRGEPMYSLMYTLFWIVGSATGDSSSSWVFFFFSFTPLAVFLGSSFFTFAFDAVAVYYRLMIAIDIFRFLATSF